MSIVSLKKLNLSTGPFLFASLILIGYKYQKLNRSKHVLFGVLVDSEAPRVEIIPKKLDS